MVWLHGTLDVTIYEGKNIPLDRVLRFHVKAAHALKPLDKLVGKAEQCVRGTHPCNTYVVVCLGDSRRARTSVIPDVNPQWNEEFSILTADRVEAVTLTVKDADMIGAPTLGCVSFPAAALAAGQRVEGWHPIIDSSGKALRRGRSALRISLSFTPVEKDPAYGPGSSSTGIPLTYLPQRLGCRVTLYNDAHQEPDTPTIDLGGGGSFQPRGAWDDLSKGLEGAQNLIYIVGWSVFTDITLVRDPGKPMHPSEAPTLGELLKAKAEAGVRVLLMLWDDKTSLNTPYLRNGLMGVHDEDTRTYFEGTKVTCCVVPREGGTVDSLSQKLTKGNMFTHHQKTVVVDAPDARNPQQRQLRAFLGGIDLCHGRYDSARHSLFRTLDTVHSDDFYQFCCPPPDPKQGPRQPWHDIHCQVEGPVATDVLVNFVQRFTKQAPDDAHRLLPLQEMDEIVVPEGQLRGTGDPAAFIIDPRDREAWATQLLRSIDSDSAAGLPTGAKACALGLDCGKGKTIDASIHTGYVTAIRRAQRFIYIENQYFLGSSHAWHTDQAVPCRHLIPLEIALKIVAKIHAGERFAAYILLPMYSEGDPESGSVQEILLYQNRTMRMMYSLIGDALKAKGATGEHPRDYLNFFCLGNREARDGPTNGTHEVSAPGASYTSRAQATRRFPIYVHSKMMIVDDEYVIVGSANINQRSQDGTRDTEIAVGALQPGHSQSNGHGFPRGQVHGFRLALWREHTGGIFDSFYEPSSLRCVREMYGIGKHNWDTYMGPAAVDLFGHLMNYPMEVLPDGSIEELPRGVCFPDSMAAIFGSKASAVPDILTT